MNKTSQKINNKHKLYIIVAIFVLLFISNKVHAQNFDSQNAIIDSKIERIQQEIEEIDPKIEIIQKRIEENETSWISAAGGCDGKGVVGIIASFVSGGGGATACVKEKFLFAWQSGVEFFNHNYYYQQKEKRRVELEKDIANLRTEKKQKESQIACLNKDRPGLDQNQSSQYEFQCSQAKAQVKNQEKINQVALENAVTAERLSAAYPCSVTQISNCVYKGITAVTMLGATLAVQLLSLTQTFFNFVLELTVSEFYVYANSTTVTELWSIIRDICNLSFIFILLYIAFNTLISPLGGDQANGSKKLLVQVIGVALLINFSAILPKIAIDASNIISLLFYNALKSVNGDATTVLMSAVNFPSILTNAGIDTLSPQGILATLGLIISSSIGATIFFTISALVFLVGSGLLVYRMVALLILIITSPLYFLGWTIPAIGKHTKDRWMNMLISQTLYLPVMLVMLWLASKIIVGTGGLSQLLVGTAGATDAISRTIIMFIIVNGLLISAFASAWKISSWGATASIGVAAGLGGAIARNTIGRGARVVAKNPGLQRMASQSGVTGLVGRNTLALSRKTSKSSFDLRSLPDTKIGKFTGLGNALKNQKIDLGNASGKGGYEAKISAQKKAEQEFVKDFSNENKIAYAESLTKRGRFGLPVKWGGVPTKRVEAAESIDSKEAKENRKIKEENKKIDTTIEAQEKLTNYQIRALKDSPAYKDAEKKVKEAQEQVKNLTDELQEAIDLGANQRQIDDIKDQINTAKSILDSRTGDMKRYKDQINDLEKNSKQKIAELQKQKKKVKEKSIEQQLDDVLNKRERNSKKDDDDKKDK